MELREVIEKRASVRKFKVDAVPVDDLREMAKLAGRAPSVNNTQPWRFVAVTNKDTLHCMSKSVKEKINNLLPDGDSEEAAKAKAQVDWFSTFFADAPAVMVVLARPYEAVVDKVIGSGPISHEAINEMRGHPDIQSIGAAVQNLLLAATDMGYGACWLSGPLVARQEIEACLEINSPWRIAAMVAIGKPSSEVTQREKKPIEEIFEVK